MNYLAYAFYHPCSRHNCHTHFTCVKTEKCSDLPISAWLQSGALILTLLAEYQGRFSPRSSLQHGELYHMPGAHKSMYLEDQLGT